MIERHRLRYEHRSRVLADHLALLKQRGNLTNRNLGELAGVGKETISHILSGEDVKLSILTFWCLLDMAGFEIRCKEAYTKEGGCSSGNL